MTSTEEEHELSGAIVDHPFNWSITSIIYTVLSIICGLILRAMDDRFKQRVSRRYDLLAFFAGAESDSLWAFYAAVFFGLPVTLLFPIWFLQGQPDNWIGGAAFVIIVLSCAMLCAPVILAPLFLWVQPLVLLFLAITNLNEESTKGKQ